MSAPAEASANPGTMGVKMQRSYHLKDEDETEIDPADLAKGLRFMKYSKNLWIRSSLYIEIKAEICNLAKYYSKF